MHVFSYDAGGLTKLVQCARISSRDYVLTLIDGPEYNGLKGNADFTCYDNEWWVPKESGSSYPAASSVPVCLRGVRNGADTDHLFTLNSAELASGFTIETSYFRIWP